MALISRVDPTRPPEHPTNPRVVLSIDGGGIRGIVPAVVLANLERITGHRTCDLFDMIVGTSTGGVLATALGAGIPAREIVALYHTQARRIFHAPWHWKLRRGFRLKAPKYPDTGLRTTLQSYLGEAMLSQSLTRVMVTAFATDPDRAGDGGIDWITSMASDFLSSQAAVVEYLHRNRSDIIRVDPQADGRSDSVALFKSWREKHAGIRMWEAAYATAAAPTYFPGIVLGNRAYFDGGIYAQNPTAIAEAEAKKLWPEAESIEYVSLASIGVNPGVPMDATSPKVLYQLHRDGQDQWDEWGHLIKHAVLPTRKLRTFD